MARLRLAGLLILWACSAPRQKPAPPPAESPEAGAAADPFAAEREKLVVETMERRGVSDARVLAAMRKVPRHEFVPAAVRARSYEDNPLPIGEGQTISQPYIVAFMTQLADVGPKDRVLEIGTGSGYQAAILGELASQVYSIEIVAPLAKSAAETLARLGYQNVEVRHGDGYRGWPEQAPFDAIVVTAAPPKIPQPLLDQLAVGGRLVAPVDVPGGDQELRVVTRTKDGYQTEVDIPVRFVPMTGEAQEK